MKLYELNEAFQNIQMLIEEGQDGLQDTLESINLAIEEKLENIAKVIKNLEAEANAFKEEEKRLAEKRRSLENNIKRLKQYAEDSLKTTGQRKVKAGLFTFSIQKNPPSVKIHDEKLIPEQFFIPVEPKIDKKTLKEMLQEGAEIPGAELVQGEGLRIR